MIKANQKDLSYFHEMFIITLISLLGIHCHWTQKEQADSKDMRPEFKSYTYSFETEGCAKEGYPCLIVKINIPEMTAGPVVLRSMFNEEMSEIVRQKMLDFSGEGDTTMHLEDIVSSLVAQHQAMTTELDGVGQAFLFWNIEINAEVLYQVDQLISISFDINTYMGGAHPNRFVEYYNYTLPDFKHLSLSEVIKDIPQVTLIAENIFRTMHQVPQDASLSDFGFWFEGDRFSLSHNFAYTSSGLVFRYNPYEIGPYAIGELEIKLPYELIRPYLVTEFPKVDL